MAGAQAAEPVAKPQTDDVQSVDDGPDMERVMQDVAAALEQLDPAQAAQVARKLAAVEQAMKDDPEGGAAALAAFWSELLSAIVSLQQGAGSLDAQQVAALIDILSTKALGQDLAPAIEAARRQLGDDGVQEVLQAMREASAGAQDEGTPAVVAVDVRKPVTTSMPAVAETAPEVAKEVPREARPVQVAEVAEAPAEVAAKPPGPRVETAVETKGETPPAPVAGERPVFRAHTGAAPVGADVQAPSPAQETAWAPEALALRAMVLSQVRDRLAEATEALPQDVVRLVKMIEKALQEGPVQAEAAEVASGEAMPAEKPARPVLPRGQVPVSVKDGIRTEPAGVDRRALDAYGQRPVQQVFKVVLAQASIALPADAPVASESMKKAVDGPAQPAVDVNAAMGTPHVATKDASMTKAVSVQAMDPKVVHQVMASAKESIRVWVHRNMTAMEVRIDPPEMGKIQIKTVVQDGRLGTLIVTDTPAARDILLAHSDELKAILKQSGLEMAGFGIELQQKERDRDLPQRRNARAFSMEELLQAEDPTEEERSGLINKVA